MANRYFPKKLLHILYWHYNLPKILTRSLKSLGYFQVKKIISKKKKIMEKFVNTKELFRERKLGGS